MPGVAESVMCSVTADPASHITADASTYVDALDDSSPSSLHKRTVLCQHRWQLWCLLHRARASWTAQMVDRVLSRPQGSDTAGPPGACPHVLSFSQARPSLAPDSSTACRPPRRGVPSQAPLLELPSDGGSPTGTSSQQSTPSCWCCSSSSLALYSMSPTT